MKHRLKRLVYLILPFFVFMCVNQTLIAQDEFSEKKFGIGIGIGYPIVDADQFSSEISFNLNLFYYLSQSLRLELKVTNMSSTVEEGTETTDFAPGKVWLTPIQLSLQYSVKMNDRFRPYLTLGAGYYFKSYDFENLEGWERLGFTIEDEIDNVLGFHAGIGLDYYLSSRMLLNLDARYAFVKLTGTYRVTESFSGFSQSGDIEAKLDPIMFSVGFSYLF